VGFVSSEGPMSEEHNLAIRGVAEAWRVISRG
jgi:hypothetical protein